MMRALLVSPHFDDAAFSCGGTVARLAAIGWEVVVVTVFTGGTHPARGFALACQRDKGLADTVDYMALRRAENLCAVEVLGAHACDLDLPEAPNRGYGSAAALFGPFVAGDDPAPIATAITRCMAELAPDLILGPAAIGGHVDHRRVLDVLLADGKDAAIAFWRDTPYVLREPAAPPDGRMTELSTITLPIEAEVPAKLRACACYASQLGFQFDRLGGMAAALRGLALKEGNGVAAERFYATPAALRRLHG